MQDARKEQDHYYQKAIHFKPVKELPVFEGKKAHNRPATVQGRNGHHVENCQNGVDHHRFHKEDPKRLKDSRAQKVQISPMGQSEEKPK